MGRASQLTGQIIAPGVVGTGEESGLTLATHKLMSPVSAHVIERSQAALSVANHEDRLIGDLGGNVGTGLAKLLAVTHPLPRALEDGVTLKVGPCYVGV